MRQASNYVGQPIMLWVLVQIVDDSEDDVVEVHQRLASILRMIANRSRRMRRTSSGVA